MQKEKMCESKKTKNVKKGDRGKIPFLQMHNKDLFHTLPL